MIKKVMLKLLGVFILTTLQAQGGQDPSPLERFDSILLADTTTIRVSNDVDRSSGNLAESDILVYDSKKEYDRIFWEKIICSRSIQENRKLDFVRAAIEDEERDIFKYQSGHYCPCLTEQPQLAKLLSNHFLSVSNFGENRLDAYQYILFVAVNGLPNSTEVINRYFKERDSYEHKFIFETKLPVYLIKKGEIDRAFELVRFFCGRTEEGSN